MRQLSIFLRILFAISIVFSIITCVIATLVFIKTLPNSAYGMIPNVLWFATQLVVPLGISVFLHFAAKKAERENALFGHIKVGKG
jgi:uncharacterized membrane protein YagU involved in acid resistance